MKWTPNLNSKWCLNLVIFSFYNRGQNFLRKLIKHVYSNNKWKLSATPLLPHTMLLLDGTFCSTLNGGGGGFKFYTNNQFARSTVQPRGMWTSKRVLNATWTRSTPGVNAFHFRCAFNEMSSLEMANAFAKISIVLFIVFFWNIYKVEGELILSSSISSCCFSLSMPLSVNVIRYTKTYRCLDRFEDLNQHRVLNISSPISRPPKSIVKQQVSNRKQQKLHVNLLDWSKHLQWRHVQKQHRSRFDTCEKYNVQRRQMMLFTKFIVGGCLRFLHHSFDGLNEEFVLSSPISSCCSFFCIRPCLVFYRCK